MLRGRPETGFLREYFVTGEEMGKTRFLWLCAGGEKPRLAEESAGQHFAISCYTVDTLYIHPHKRVKSSE